MIKVALETVSMFETTSFTNLERVLYNLIMYGMVYCDALHTPLTGRPLYLEFSSLQID